MTPQTLTAQRREKFTKIIEQSELYAECNLQWNDAYLETGVKAVVEQLIEASLSRSERATDEQPVEYKVTSSTFVNGKQVGKDIVDGILESDAKAKTEHAALDAFEVAFKLDPGNIPWFKTKPEWTRLRRVLVEKYLSDPDYFKKYHKWYTEAGKFAGGMNIQQMRRDPDGFVLAMNIFEAATIGEVAHKTDLPQYKKVVAVEEEIAQNPNRKPK